MLASMIFCWGCERDMPQPVVVEPVPSPVTSNPDTSIASEQLADTTACGASVYSNTYPVTVHVRVPPKASRNDTFTYYITVGNGSSQPLYDVRISEAMPKGFTYVGANPVPKTEADTLNWVIPTLIAGASKEIAVIGKATQTGCLEHCVDVAWSVNGCANTMVVEPNLVLTRLWPDQVLICDPISVKYAVSNAGTGLATGVRITETLPSGLRTREGLSSVVLNVGDLQPGQSRRFDVEMKASRTGSYTSKAVVGGQGSVKAESTEQTIRVQQPVLELLKTGPENVYVGRSIKYQIRLTNKGDGPARDTVVEDVLPAGATDIQASANGQVLESKVVWNLGVLNPGQSRDMSLSYTPEQAGTRTNTATATAYCAEGAKATVTTAVKGIAAILLEVVDVEDPIPVGDEVTYVITATNQGSQAGTNIRILCTLEANERYVSSSGATAGLLIGDNIRFAPLPVLEPGKKGTWTVRVRAVQSGDVRFKVEMNTDQIGRPVIETEATHLYE